MAVWVSTNRVRAPLVVMAIVEAAILFSSVYVAAFLVFGSIDASQSVLGSIAPKAALIAFIILLSLVAMGLYQFNQRLYFREAVLRLIVGLVAGSLALAVLFYAFPRVMVGREIASIAIGYALILLLVTRYLFTRIVDESVFRRRTLIYGAGKRASSIAELRRRADRRGFKVVGKVAAPGDKVDENTIELLRNDKTINELAADSNADEIVIAMDERRGNLPIRDLLDARLNGIDVIDILEFLERESGKIRLDLINPGWLIFSPGFRISRFRVLSQRALDVFVSTAIIVFSWPLMLVTAIAIKIEDGISAPVLYRQERVGKSKNVFNVLKFRSMRTDAEADGRAVWASADDPRTTKVGRVIRHCRLDELPQVLNVIGGTMSLVGPRPERPEFVRELEEAIPYYGERHAVKPGVTGWAQLKYSYGSTKEDAIEKLQYDLYYIKNQSLLLDVMIILQTVEVVLWGKGAR